jgi:hypothetical protein
MIADNLTSSLSHYIPLAASTCVKPLGPPLPLWTGRSAPVSSPHALNGVLQGYLPFRNGRGSCAIQSATCSLWFFVAESLGFNVKVAWSGDPLFSTVMSDLFPRTRFVPRPQLTASYDVDLVLGDCSGVPNHESYWTARPVPHLLAGSITSCSGSSHSPPASWTRHSHLFKHSDMGGSTDGIHKLMLFVPPMWSSPSKESPPLLKQPWIPLQAALHPVTSARPADKPQVPTVRDARVYHDGSEVLPFGLFPASRPASLVRVPCVFNTPVKWGVRQLTQEEAATLWDVPLLLQERLARDGYSTMLGRFLHGVPGKTLLLGGDYLLSSQIRGGWCAPRATGRKGMTEETRDSELSPLAVTQVEEEVAPVQVVVKADHQKADDAAVPVHLWNSMSMKARTADRKLQHPLASRW